MKNLQIGLGVLILISNVLYIFMGQALLPGIAIFIVTSFGLIALSMNYKGDKTERNAWDIWFSVCREQLLAYSLLAYWRTAPMFGNGWLLR